MFSVASTPSLLVQPLPPAAAVNPQPTEEAAIGRLPQTAVAQTIAPPEAQNNGKGTGGQIYYPARTFSLTPAEVFAAPAQDTTPATLRFGFSSTFLAQLFSQGGSAAESAALVQMFEGDYAPAPGPLEQGTLQYFSQVRYSPSNAALPPPPQGTGEKLSRPAAQKGGDGSAADTSRPNLPGDALKSLRAAFNGSEVKQPAPAQVGRGSFEPVFIEEEPAAQASLPLPLPVRQAPAAKRSSSLLSLHSASGYTATQTRNARNLAPEARQEDILL